VTDTKLDLDTLTLAKGNHHDRSNGLCAMEAVAWLAGEKHNDQPDCVSPVIGAFVRRWNDDLGDNDRQKLKPILPTLIGTAADLKTESRRAWMVTDWMVRTYMPAWLDLAGLTEQATAVRGLPELRSSQARQRRI